MDWKNSEVSLSKERIILCFSKKKKKKKYAQIGSGSGTINFVFVFVFFFLVIKWANLYNKARFYKKSHVNHHIW